MILFLAGLFSGILGGMGIGGGTVLIPTLSFFTDLTQQQIQGINLIYFIPSALAAVIIHAKKGSIEKKGLTPMIIAAVIFSATGAFIAMFISGDLLRKLFAVFLFIIGIKELLKKDNGK